MKFHQFVIHYFDICQTCRYMRQDIMGKPHYQINNILYFLVIDQEIIKYKN